MSAAQPTVDTKSISEDSTALVEAAEQCRDIATREELEGAASLLRSCKYLRKAIEQTFRPHISDANQLHKGLIATFRGFDDPLKGAEGHLKRAMGAYETEQRRLAAEQERAAAEKLRQQEEARRLDEAIELEREGDAKAAEEALEAPVIAPAPAPQRREKAPEGISYRKRWWAEVNDLEALVKAVASGKAPLHFLQANETALNAAARGMRETFDVPGCLARSENTVAARGE